MLLHVWPTHLKRCWLTLSRYDRQWCRERQLVGRRTEAPILVLVLLPAGRPVPRSCRSIRQKCVCPPASSRPPPFPPKRPPRCAPALRSPRCTDSQAVHPQPLFLARSLCQDACSRPLPPPASGLAIQLGGARLSSPLSIIAALCDETGDDVRCLSHCGPTRNRGGRGGNSALTLLSAAGVCSIVRNNAAFATG